MATGGGFWVAPGDNTVQSRQSQSVEVTVEVRASAKALTGSAAQCCQIGNYDEYQPELKKRDELFRWARTRAHYLEVVNNFPMRIVTHLVS